MSLEQHLAMQRRGRVEGKEKEVKTMWRMNIKSHDVSKMEALKTAEDTSDVAM